MPNKKYKGFRWWPQTQARQKQPNRGSKRKQLSEVQLMAAAIDAVTQQGFSANQAADRHGIPSSTLKDSHSGGVIHGVNPGPRPYLTRKEESELASHLLSASAIGYG